MALDKVPVVEVSVYCPHKPRQLTFDLTLNPALSGFVHQNNIFQQMVLGFRDSMVNVSKTGWPASNLPSIT